MNVDFNIWLKKTKLVNNRGKYPKFALNMDKKQVTHRTL